MRSGKCHIPSHVLVAERYWVLNDLPPTALVGGARRESDGRAKRSGDYFEAKAYYENEGYDFNIYFDTNMEAVNNYGLTGYPATFFIDEEGYLEASAGGMIDLETLEKGIDLIRN